MALAEEDLVYAAYSRCPCGAGLAYVPGGDHPSGVPIGGYWDCSDILLERAMHKGPPSAARHTAQLPFVFYEIKSERQPSAGGATTRPGGVARNVYT